MRSLKSLQDAFRSDPRRGKNGKEGESLRRGVSAERRGVSAERRGVSAERRGVSAERRGVSAERRGVSVERRELLSAIEKKGSLLGSKGKKGTSFSERDF